MRDENRERTRQGVDRRQFLKTSLYATALIPAAGALLPRSARAELVSEIPANEALLQGLQYTPKSEKPDQSCKNCSFYTPGEGGVGKCQLIMEGNVPEGGWCMSWAAKPA